MSRSRRIVNIFIGMLTMLGGVIMAVDPRTGYLYVLLILEITLLIHGLRLIVYYVFMARHMIGGIRVLYAGVLLLDAVLFALTLDEVPRQYAMLYLIGYQAFTGLVDILRAREQKAQEVKHWEYQLFYGITKLIIAVVCLCNLTSVYILTFVYCLGLFHSALTRIANACRRTEVVYIN